MCVCVCVCVFVCVCVCDRESERERECVCECVYIYIYIYIYYDPQKDCFVLSDLFSVARHVGRSMYIRGSLNNFPDFFRMGPFIDSTHMKL